jgi:hypothetical protein
MAVTIIANTLSRPDRRAALQNAVISGIGVQEGVWYAEILADQRNAGLRINITAPDQKRWQLAFEGPEETAPDFVRRMIEAEIYFEPSGTKQQHDMEDASLRKAGEYLEGYADGLGRGLDGLPQVSEGGIEGSYGEGFRRGLGLGSHRASQPGPAGVEMNRIRAEMRQLDSSSFLSEEEKTRWEFLNGRVRQGGRESWEDILLEFYANLRIFSRLCVTLSSAEKFAIEVVSHAVVVRFSKALKVPE